MCETAKLGVLGERERQKYLRDPYFLQIFYRLPFAVNRRKGRGGGGGDVFEFVIKDSQYLFSATFAVCRPTSYFHVLREVNG